MSGTNPLACSPRELSVPFGAFNMLPSTNDPRELGSLELDLVCGAVNGVQVAEGVAMGATAVLAVASAPVTLPVAAAACVLAACGGYIAGHGLTH
jgi:hypothetical protein